VPITSSPLEEINNFEQNAPVEDDALPPVLDVEATPTSRTCHRHLTEDGAIADMQVMLQEMERHYGKRPIIYATVDFYEAILSDGALMDYPIWVRSTKYPWRTAASARLSRRRMGLAAWWGNFAGHGRTPT
jgi:lysozyme